LGWCAPIVKIEVMCRATLSLLYTPHYTGMAMPKGFKPTSSTIIISGTVTETAINTLITETVNLSLNTLDQEVFVVTAINLDFSAPDLVAATNTIVRGSISVTDIGSFGSIGDPNVIAAGRLDIRSTAPTAAVGFMQMAGEAPQGELDYIALISTSNFHVQVVGSNNIAVKGMGWRVWGYRAKVTDAGIYAALVQSELLSA